MRLPYMLICCAVFLSACGSLSTLREEQNTDYVLVSDSQIGGIWKLIRGQAKACKVTMHGTLPKFVIAYDGETCQVQAQK